MLMPTRIHAQQQIHDITMERHNKVSEAKLDEYSGLTDGDDDGELLNGEVSGVGGVPRGAGR